MQIATSFGLSGATFFLQKSNSISFSRILRSTKLHCLFLRRYDSQSWCRFFFVLAKLFVGYKMRVRYKVEPAIREISCKHYVSSLYLAAKYTNRSYLRSNAKLLT